MKSIAIIALLTALTGCAEINMIRSAIGLYGAEAARATADDAEWVLCHATPVGAIKKKYNTPELMDTYNNLCLGEKIKI